jgi:hypothetical protein
MKKSYILLGLEIEKKALEHAEALFNYHYHLRPLGKKNP